MGTGYKDGTMQVEDKKGNGSKRKHTESTEEVTAMKAGVKKTGTDLSKKLEESQASDSRDAGHDQENNHHRSACGELHLGLC